MRAAEQIIIFPLNKREIFVVPNCIKCRKYQIILIAFADA